MIYRPRPAQPSRLLLRIAVTATTGSFVSLAACFGTLATTPDEGDGGTGSSSSSVPTPCGFYCGGSGTSSGPAGLFDSGFSSGASSSGSSSGSSCGGFCGTVGGPVDAGLDATRLDGSPDAAPIDACAGFCGTATDANNATDASLTEDAASDAQSD